jgi:hypothetical protein
MMGNGTQALRRGQTGNSVTQSMRIDSDIVKS